VDGEKGVLCSERVQSSDECFRGYWAPAKGRHADGGGSTIAWGEIAGEKGKLYLRGSIGERGAGL